MDNAQVPSSVGIATATDGAPVPPNVMVIGDVPLPHEMVGALKMQLFAGCTTLRSFTDECMKGVDPATVQRINEAIERAQVDLVTAATGIERHLLMKAQ